jgi:hypothetical protein
MAASSSLWYFAFFCGNGRFDLNEWIGENWEFEKKWKSLIWRWMNGEKRTLRWSVRFCSYDFECRHRREIGRQRYEMNGGYPSPMPETD